MNRRRADAAVGLLLAAILAVGGALSWQAYQQQRMFSQMMPMMGSGHGTNPLLYVFGTVLTAGVIAGLYLTVRPDLAPPTVDGQRPPPTTDPPVTEGVDPDTDGPVAAPDDSTPQPRGRVLDLLPEDERRILEPVITSPGITQIELRDRSDFSKSKVSQTVSDLEKRGLLSRERQGRTYRVYPTEDLQDR